MGNCSSVSEVMPEAMLNNQLRQCESADQTECTCGVLSCGLSGQHGDLGASLLNELLQVDLSKLFCQLLQLLLPFLWWKIHHES